MKKLLIAFLLLTYVCAVKSQSKLFAGNFYESKSTLLNGEDGSDYTLNQKKFRPELKLNFIKDSNVVYDGTYFSRKYYSLSENLLTIKSPMKRKFAVDTFYIYYKIETDKDVLILSDYKEGTDERFFLKKHFMTRSPGDQTEPSIAPDEIFTIVEETPGFPGGPQEMYNFISKNINYPKGIEDGKPVEKVFVKLLIAPDGKIADAEILNTPRVEFVKEAMNVIRKFPAFVPGRQNGKAVFVYYNLPITFKRE